MSKISKRNFLLRTAAATTAVLVWEPLISFSQPTKVMALRRLSLNGSWELSQANKENWLSAIVPGGAYTDLLAAGKIPDPFQRDNEKNVQWVGDADWVYRRTFEVPGEILENDRVLLRCDGLDTLAKITINGQPAGSADNMFRLWEFDVKALLRAGTNSIEILFESPAAYMKRRDSEIEPEKWIKGRAWVRKEPCCYGWDWGPVLPTCGIWKNIGLETFNRARIADILIQQEHADNQVAIRVAVNTEMVAGQAGLFQARLAVSQANSQVVVRTLAINDGRGMAEVWIKKPKLWWPAGLGEQPLYAVQVELLDPAGRIIDSAIKRIGLRELKAVLPTADNPLHFEVNGVPFFAKGANWIPADSFPTRVTPEISRRFVADAVAANMNMLRFWGGGYYEDDAMFDACDELGICVWLDFKFACAAYPAFDADFMENVRREARDNLVRLRHHPCIAVWCGNNEISLDWWKGPTWGPNRMSAADYDKLFKELLEAQVKKYAPGANYVSGSPDCGDTHYWEVWHGPKPFEAYRTQNGFMSEFGYQSFPEPKTVRAFTDAADRASVVTPVMGWHQRSGGVQGNQKIVAMALNYFKPPRDFEATLWLSQIMQGYGIKIGAEYWRQTMPKSMGCVFWQYNDCWPGMSWSSVDYFGRWKALQYLAAKFYAPALVSGVENLEKGTVEIYVSSDHLKNHDGRLTWQVTDLAGKSLLKDSLKVGIPARKSERVKIFELNNLISKFGANGVLVWLTLESGHVLVSENMISFVRPKELGLEDPKITAEIEKVTDGFSVTVKSEKPALWVWLDLDDSDAKYADNFFHLRPGLGKTILVRPKKTLTRNEFVAQLRIRSLVDTHA